jgi:hypothetical protein
MSAWCKKAELSDGADSEKTKEAPLCRVCITLGSMFTRKGAAEDRIDVQHAEEARGYLHGLDAQGLVPTSEIEIGPQQSRRRLEQVFSLTEPTKLVAETLVRGKFNVGS